MNYFSLYLSGNVLISPSFLKVSFSTYRILGWQFSFMTLNMSSHYSLVSMVSGEKSDVNLIEDPLYMRNCLSLTAFNVLSFHKSIIMCVGLALFEFILLGIWASWTHILIFLLKLGNFGHFFSVFSPRYSLSFPSGISVMRTLVCFMVSHRSLRLCSFFLMLFFPSAPHT